MDCYEVLKHLLQSWNLIELFEHFKHEGVYVEELQLMKPHHIEKLLCNFTIGIRIRFDHHFEIWRRNLNLPLQHNVGYINCKPNRTSKPHLRSRSTNSENAAVNAKNVCTIIPRYMLPPQPLKQVLKKSSKSTDQQQQPTTATVKPMSVTTQRVLRQPSSTPRVNESKTSSSAQPSQSEKTFDGSISLMHILEKSGSKGKTLLKYYKENDNFSSTHRLLLINLIVDFFEKNHYHLSLSMSYHLEKQILSTFPTEKLKYYRKKTRGKIYIKFCNKKRPKPVKRRSESETDENDDITDNNDEDEEINYDDFNKEVAVKLLDHRPLVEMKSEHLNTEGEIK